MRNVIVSNIMTLDGFSAGPGSNPMVLNMDAAFDALNLELMRTAGTVLLGRSSFELFGSFWPMVADAPVDPANPALSDVNREFSRRYRDVPKIVVGDTTSIADDHPWAHSTELIARAGAPARIAAEREKDDGDIVVFASHVLWNDLLAAGLVDELYVIVGPSAIGEGVPMFERPVALELVEVRALEGSSNVLHRYRPAK